MKTIPSWIRNGLMALGIAALTSFNTSCETQGAGKGAIVGAAGGAIIGAIAGEDKVLEGAIIGAGVGAVAGAHRAKKYRGTGGSPASGGSQYPYGTSTSNPNYVKSPYSPYNVIDVTGFRSGELAIDPTTNKVFRVP